MFSKKHRLSKNHEVKTALVRGRSFFNPFFTVKYLNTALPAARFTIVVSTKVSKKAVVRNRIKRVVRENIRLKLATVKIGDYVIIAKPKVANLPNAEIKQSIISLLSSARLL